MTTTHESGKESKSAKPGRNLAPGFPARDGGESGLVEFGTEGSELGQQLSTLGSSGAPPPLAPRNVVALQRMAGNRAVQRLLRPGGNGAQTQQPRPPIVQARLRVGPVNDPYEQEADRVADAAVQRMQSIQRNLTAPRANLKGQDEDSFAGPIGIQRRPQTEDMRRRAKDSVQRLAYAEGGDLDHATARQIQTAGGGSTLAPQHRTPLEQALGYNLAKMRVHTDSKADSLNRSLDARAFTTGEHVFFRSGEFNPKSRDGQKLLAHEATHVVQQTGGEPLSQRAMTDSVADSVTDSVTESRATIQRAPVGVQRVLIDKARQAFDEAIKVNPKFQEGRDLVDGKTGEQTNVTESEQKEITQLRGVFSRMAAKFKTMDDADAQLEHFLRAHLLWEFAKRVVNIPTDPRYDTPKKQKAARKRYLKRNLKDRDKLKALLSKGAVAAETKVFLEMIGLDTGAKPSTELEQTELSKGPRIDVRSTFIGGGTSIRAHLFIVYTASDGKQTFFRGGPDEQGYTVAHMGEYKADTVDYDPSAPSTTIATGPEAMTKLPGLVEATSIIKGMKVPYEAQLPGKFKPAEAIAKKFGFHASLSGENCNAAAWTILTRAGFSSPKKPRGIHPGWGSILGSKSGKGDKPPDKVDYSTMTGEEYTVKEDYEMQAFVDPLFVEPSFRLPGEGTKVEFLGEGRNYLRIRYADKIGYIHKSKADVQAYTKQEVRSIISDIDPNDIKDAVDKATDPAYTSDDKYYVLNVIGDELDIDDIQVIFDVLDEVNLTNEEKLAVYLNELPDRQLDNALNDPTAELAYAYADQLSIDVEDVWDEMHKEEDRRKKAREIKDEDAKVRKRIFADCQNQAEMLIRIHDFPDYDYMHDIAKDLGLDVDRVHGVFIDMLGDAYPGSLIKELRKVDLNVLDSMDENEFAIEDIAGRYKLPAKFVQNKIKLIQEKKKDQLAAHRKHKRMLTKVTSDMSTPEHPNYWLNDFHDYSYIQKLAQEFDLDDMADAAEFLDELRPEKYRDMLLLIDFQEVEGLAEAVEDDNEDVIAKLVERHGVVADFIKHKAEEYIESEQDEEDEKRVSVSSKDTYDDEDFESLLDEMEEELVHKKEQKGMGTLEPGSVSISLLDFRAEEIAEISEPCLIQVTDEKYPDEMSGYENVSVLMVESGRSGYIFFGDLKRAFVPAETIQESSLDLDDVEVNEAQFLDLDDTEDVTESDTLYFGQFHEAVMAYLDSGDAIDDVISGTGWVAPSDFKKLNSKQIAKLAGVMNTTVEDVMQQISELDG